MSRTNEVKLNVAGLVLAAIGMVVQMGAGSELYPSVTGPIVLLVVAAVVAFRPGRWAGYAGLVVPLVLGVGLIVSAFMSPAFLAQLTETGNVPIVLGSLLHVIGLIAGVAGGVGMVLRGSRQSVQTA